MLTRHLLFSAAFCCLAVYARYECKKKCCPGEELPVESKYDFEFAYANQPFFVSFLPKTEQNSIIDNICLTYFPLPDDPNTFNAYFSTVFCDGSNRIETVIITLLQPGRFRASDPFCTYSSNIVGYAGCDTYLDYRCFEYGECDESAYFLGLSTKCQPLGLSCIRKIEELVSEMKMPEAEYFVLPMQLENRCVTEQLCTNNIEGSFYRALNIPAPPPQPAFTPTVTHLPPSVHYSRPSVRFA